MTDRTTGLPVVGMVGGGQLARMTHQAGISLGLSLRVLAEDAVDGAALVSPDVEIGAATDWDAPALHFAQDKRAMRERLDALGIPVPRWTNDPDELPRPYIAKAVRGGYDGRGVWVIEAGDELPKVDHIIEERVTIVHELAVQVARTPSGVTKCWPVVQTVQEDGICVEVIAPVPRLSHALIDEAQALAVRIANELDVVGVLAVELFEAPQGLMVNELAMRPHNSGGPHTDLSKTLPAALAAAPDCSIHLYGKSARPGRKLGHVTALGDDVDETRERARRAVAILRGDHE